MALTEDAWNAVATGAVKEVEAYHAAHPLRPGMAREELRSKMRLPPSSFPAVLAGLVAQGSVVEREGAVAAPNHDVAVETGGPAARLLELLGENRFAPPSLPDAMQRSGAGSEVVRAFGAARRPREARSGRRLHA